MLIAILLPVCIALIAIFLAISSSSGLNKRLMSLDDLPEIRNDLSGIRVALFFDRGMDAHSALALGRAFQWMGCHVEIVNDDRVKSASLDSYDVFACPGCQSRPDPWGTLGLEGKSNIREFVKSGGGYIGICLGALYASDTCDFWGVPLAEDELYLDMFHGVACCGQEDIAPQGGWPLMTWLRTSIHAHAIMDSLPERMKIVYYPSSPYLQPYEGANITIVATYEANGQPAMVAFEYNEGKVFLSGPHPEIEVDSDRDGSSRFSDLSDEGSEWPLLLAVVKWMTH